MDTIRGTANAKRIEHLPPADHPAFCAASRYTLNVSSADMIARTGAAQAAGAVIRASRTGS